MRPRGRRLLLLAASLGCLAFLSTPTPGATDGPTIEPAESSSGYRWSPSTATFAPGGAVAFRNPSTAVPHGLAWTSGPAKPSCSGVPVDSSGTEWSGSCSFAQAGTYAFVCTVHAEMQGTITVAAGEPAPPPPPGTEQGPGVPPAAAPVQRLRLAMAQRGHVVRGSLELSDAAAGGRLTLELRASRRALDRPGGGTARVGKLVRSELTAGPQSFAVALAARARRALARRERLSISVRIHVALPSAAAEALTRKVVLHE